MCLYVTGRTAIASNEKRVYNYRLSRARRTIENAFGILVARWRCMSKPLHMSQKHAESVILACCVLHNFMIKECVSKYTPPGYCDSVDTSGAIVDGSWRLDNVHNEQPANTNQRNSTLRSIAIREQFISYFNNEGAVEWQLQHINRTN